MSYQFILKEQAQYELEDAIAFYEHTRKNLGLTFLEECEYIFNINTYAP